MTKIKTHQAQPTPKKQSALLCVFIVILCAFFLIYKYLLQVFPGIISNQIMMNFHIDALGLGNLGACFFYSYFIVQFFVGVILDRFGTRWLASGAIVISSLGLLFFSQSHSVLGAALSRVAMGFGVAFATVTYMKMAAQWFDERHFPLVSGLAATAAMLGAIFGEAPLNKLVQLSNWRHALLIISIAGFILALLFVLFVKDNPKLESTHCDSLESEKKRSKLVEQILIVFTNKQNWLLTCYAGLCFSPIAIFGGLWGTPFLSTTYHYTISETSSLLTLVFLGLAIGGPIFGWLDDMINKPKSMMIVGGFIELFCLLGIIYWHTSSTIVLSIMLFGFGLGSGAFLLSFAIGRHINPIAVAGTAIALINSGDGIIGGFTEPLIGKLLDHGWRGEIKNGVHIFPLHDYQLSFMIIPAYIIAAMFTIAFMKTKHVAKNRSE